MNNMTAYHATQAVHVRKIRETDIIKTLSRNPTIFGMMCRGCVGLSGELI